jgi:hypothetical protein
VPGHLDDRNGRPNRIAAPFRGVNRSAIVTCAAVSNIYAKLGVRFRAELAGRLGSRD